MTSEYTMSLQTARYNHFSCGLWQWQVKLGH